jgi:hypothetical protein
LISHFSLIIETNNSTGPLDKREKMTKLNKKLRMSIGKHVQTILEDQFDEDTVKLLLMDIRDFSTGLENLQEICHFVAHPERNKGSIHKKILSRFLRLRYMNEIMERAMAEKEMHPPKPMEDFGDYVYRTVPIEHYREFDKKHFELLLIGGLNDFDDSFFRNNFRRSKGEIAQLVSSNYRKDKGKYILRSNHDIDIIKTIFILETSVQFQPLISEEEIIKELKISLLRIASDLNLSKPEVELIFSRRDDLFLAMLGLLHDISFVWSETVIGRSFLSVNESKIDLRCDFYPNGKSVSFPLVQTIFLINNYVENGQVVVGELSEFMLHRSVNGKLIYK